MKKPFTLVAALLVGSLYFAGCQSSKTPTSGSSTSTSTASPDNSSYRTSSNNTGNNDPSNMSNGGTPERVGTGTASGSTIATSPSPGVTIPLGTGSANGGQTGNTAIENNANSTTNQAAPGNSPGMTTNTGTSALGGTGATGSMNQNSTTSEVTLSNPSSATGNQSLNANQTTPGATAPRTGAVTAPAGNENWSANRNNPVRQSDAMDNNGVSGGQNTGVATDTTGKVSSTLTPTPAPAASNVQEAQRSAMLPGNTDQRAPERLSMDGERNAATSAKPASGQATTMAPSERERMGRSRTTQAGMEQQRAAQQMNSSTSITPETPIERLTKQLDAIDEELEKKTSARRRSTLIKQRKNLMLALGKAKAAQLPVPE